MIDPFERAQKTLDWGEETIADGLKDFISFTQDENSFARKIELDPQTGEAVYKVTQERSLPHSIEGRWIDGLNSLRNCFDQATFAACVAIGEPRKVNYPWADSPTDLDIRLKGRKGKPTYPPVLWDEFRRQQPYPTGQGYSGGDDIIREISKFANAKHTVGFEIRGEVIRTVIGHVSFGASGMIRMDRPRWDPVKKEIEVLRARSAIMQDHPEVQISIFFSTAGTIARLPAFQALAYFAHKAQSVLDGLKAECGRITGG